MNRYDPTSMISLWHIAWKRGKKKMSQHGVLIVQLENQDEKCPASDVALGQNPLVKSNIDYK